MSRLTATTVAILTAGFALGGCRIANNEFSDTSTEQATVTEVRLSGSAGSVEIDRSGQGETTRIERRVDYGEEKPTRSFHRVERNVLYLDTDCGRDCSIEYRVRVPAAVKVNGGLSSGQISVAGVTTATLVTQSGRISITDATGDVNAKSNSGRIIATHVGGRLNASTNSGALRVDGVGGATILETDSGAIHADGLAGTQTTAKTSSGALTLTLANAQDVTAQTSSGRLSVTVPAGASYRVRQRSSSGDIRVTIPVDPAGKYSMNLLTSSGAIAVTSA